MISNVGSRATLLLKHRPSDERCNEIASEIAKELGVPAGSISWYVSDSLPKGYAVHTADQIEAMKRDADDGAVYFTVTVLSSVGA